MSTETKPKTTTTTTRRSNGTRRSAPRSGGGFGGGGLFTLKQKARLSQLARQAFDVLHGHGAIEPETGESVSAFFERWRRREQGAALGRGGPVSLTVCRQRDYRTLEVHWLALAGKIDGHSFGRAMASEPEDESQRQILHRLREEMERWGISRPYAEAIAFGVYGRTELEGLAAEEARNLIATVRRRGVAIAKKAAKAKKAEIGK